METIKTRLRARLADAGRIAVLGIGSELRGDDAAGLLVIDCLGAKPARRSGTILKVFYGSTAPENITGEIRKFKPTHLIMVDTVDLRKKPGTVIMLEPHEIGSGVSFSTHKMPAKILIDYLLNSIECDIFVIGIQPKRMDFGRPVSGPVALAVKNVVSDIRLSVSGKKHTKKVLAAK